MNKQIQLLDLLDVNLQGLCLLNAETHKKALENTVAFTRTFGFFKSKCCAVFTLGVHRKKFVKDLILSCYAAHSQIIWKDSYSDTIIKKLKESKIYVDDSKKLKPMEIVNKCRDLPLEVIIINNIVPMEYGVCEELKRISKRLGVLVLANVCLESK